MDSQTRPARSRPKNPALWFTPAQPAHKTNTEKTQDAEDYSVVNARPEAASIQTLAEQHGVAPSANYSWRPPSPRHIHVPQAPDDHEISLNTYRAVGYKGQEEQILRIITESQTSVLSRGDWKYEYRRNAQAILSFLYLGPSAAARDVEFLRTEGVTMLLAIRDAKSAFANLVNGEKVAQQLGIQAAKIDVTGHQELISLFPTIIRGINQHLIAAFLAGKTGKVLVFCESGNERSAAAVAAYVMNMYGMDLVTSLQYIQSQRFCVAFDDDLKNLLLTYNELVTAARSVSVSNASNQQGALPVKVPGKRGRPNTLDDNDMDMDHQDDLERFGGRHSFAPFQDRN